MGSIEKAGAGRAGSGEKNRKARKGAVYSRSHNRASLLTVFRVIYAIVRLNSRNFVSLLQNLSKYRESAKSCVRNALAMLTSLGFRQTDKLLTRR